MEIFLEACAFVCTASLPESFAVSLWSQALSCWATVDIHFRVFGFFCWVLSVPPRCSAVAQTLSGRTGSGQVGKAWRALVAGFRAPSPIRALTKALFFFTLFFRNHALSKPHSRPAQSSFDNLLRRSARVAGLRELGLNPPWAQGRLRTSRCALPKPHD